MVKCLPMGTAWKVVMTIRENPKMPKSRVTSECNISAHTPRNILQRIQDDADNPLHMMKQPHLGARKINCLHMQQQELCDYMEINPFVTEEHRQQRLAFANRHPHWGWDNIMCSDECTISTAMRMVIMWVKL